MTQEFKQEAPKGAVDFDALCAAMAEKGLLPKDILEAELFHNAALLSTAEVKMMVERKAKMLPLMHSVASKGGLESMALLTGEVILTGAAQQIPGLVAAMCKHGVMDKDRASKNWMLVEEYLASIAPTPNIAEDLRELLGALADLPKPN